MQEIDLFKNLVVMAAADGSITADETQLLASRAEHVGLTAEEFKTALDFALAGEGSIELPDSDSARKAMLGDLIRLMAADGQLADKEKHLFATVAAKMNLSKDDLNSVIDTVVNG